MEEKEGGRRSDCDQSTYHIVNNSIPVMSIQMTPLTLPLYHIVTLSILVHSLLVCPPPTYSRVELEAARQRWKDAVGLFVF